MNRPLLALVCALGLVLTGCDEGAAGLTGPSESTVASADGASLTNYDMGFNLHNGATTLYIVPRTQNSTTPLITCTAGSGTYDVRVNVQNGSSGTADCDGQIQREYTYLLFAEGQTNGATLFVPLAGTSIGGTATLASSGAWSDNGSWSTTVFDLVSRDISFTFPTGLYSTAEYHSFWEPVWTVNVWTYELPAIDTKVRLTYTNSSGGTSNLTVFDGVGTYTDGTWSAQAGSSGTIRATDNVSGDFSTASFSIPNPPPPPPGPCRNGVCA